MCNVCLISPVSILVPCSLVPVDRQVSDCSFSCVTLLGVFETSGSVILIDILTYVVIVLCSFGFIL